MQGHGFPIAAWSIGTRQAAALGHSKQFQQTASMKLKGREKQAFCQVMRSEDFPSVSSSHAWFRVEPWDFFDENAAMDVPAFPEDQEMMCP